MFPESRPRGAATRMNSRHQRLKKQLKILRRQKQTAKTFRGDLFITEWDVARCRTLRLFAAGDWASDKKSILASKREQRAKRIFTLVEELKARSDGGAGTAITHTWSRLPQELHLRCSHLEGGSQPKDSQPSDGTAAEGQLVIRRNSSRRTAGHQREIQPKNSRSSERNAAEEGPLVIRDMQPKNGRSSEVITAKEKLSIRGNHSRRKARHHRETQLKDGQSSEGNTAGALAIVTPAACSPKAKGSF